MDLDDTDPDLTLPTKTSGSAMSGPAWRTVPPWLYWTQSM